MKMTLSKDELSVYTQKQLDFYIPDGYAIDEKCWTEAIDTALQRCDSCFKHIIIPQYRSRENGESLFSHLHRDQYATFIYFLGNTIWLHYHDRWLCDKLLNLQSILHSFFLSYKCEMPNVFVLAHPVGSVIGNAKYSDGLYICQNVTINTHTDAEGNPDLFLGKGVVLETGATIIGNKPIGDRVTIGPNVLIHNEKIDSDYTCVSERGKVIIRPRQRERCVAERVFDINLY